MNLDPVSIAATVLRHMGGNRAAAISYCERIGGGNGVLAIAYCQAAALLRGER